MKYKKILIVTFILLAILSVGAVSASEDADVIAQDSDVIVSQDNTIVNEIIEDNSLATDNNDVLSNSSIEDSENNPFFLSSPGPVDPKEEVGVGLVLQVKTNGIMEVVDLNKNSKIVENLNISDIEPVYQDDEFEYLIPLEEFEFEGLEHGDLVAFRFYGDDGSSCEDLFSFVGDRDDGLVHFDYIGPNIEVEEEIETDKDSLVATLVIPANPYKEGEVPYFTGSLEVWGRVGCLYSGYINEENATEIPIYLSDLNYFDDLSNGSHVSFEFVGKNGKVLAYENRAFRQEDGIIILERYDEEDIDFYADFRDANVVENETVVIIPEDQIPEGVDDDFSIRFEVWGYEIETTSWNINNLTLGDEGYEWNTADLLINEWMFDKYPKVDMDIVVQFYRNGEEAEQARGNVMIYHTPYIYNAGEVGLIYEGPVVAFAYFPENAEDEFYIVIHRNGSSFANKTFKISEMDQYVIIDEYYLLLNDLGITEEGTYDLSIIFIDKDSGNEFSYNGSFIVSSFIIEFYYAQGDVIDEMDNSLCRIELPEDAEGTVIATVDGNKVFEKTLEEIGYIEYLNGPGYYISLNSLNITESGDYNVTVNVESNYGRKTAGDILTFNVTENIFEFRDSIYGDSNIEICHMGTAISEDSEIILYLNGEKAATGTFDYDFYFDFDEKYVDIYGKLLPGEYQAELEIDGKVVCDGAFEVKDTSGNVDVNVTTDNCTVYVNFKAPMPSDESLAGYALNVYVDSQHPGDIAYDDGEPTLHYEWDDLEELLDNKTHALELGEYEPGEHIVYVVYRTDLDYSLDEQDFFVRIFNITVVEDEKSKTILTADDLKTKYNSGDHFTVKLTDDYGNPIYSAAITASFDDFDETAYTDEFGLANVSVQGLKPGNYTPLIKFDGSEDLGSSSTTANVVIDKADSNITALMIITNYNSDEGFLVYLVDEYDYPIYDAAVVAVFEEFNETVYTDEIGWANVSVKGLKPDSYTPLIKFEGNDYYNPSNTTANVVITKTDSKMTALDIKVPYNSDEGFLVYLADAYGYPIYDAKLVAVINEFMKTVYTDEIGWANVSVKGLKSGNYTPLVMFVGNDCYNPSNATANVEITKANTKITTIYQDGILSAFLTDENGNPISGASVGFSIDGLKYVVTDANGEAKYSTSGLAEGTYTIKVQYYGDENYNQSNQVVTKITIKKIATKLSSSDVSVLCGSDGYLVATLKDANGKPVEGASVGFANYGVKYFVTDANGQAKYPTSGLAEGTYNVKMCYYGNGIYAASNQVSAKITVGKIATKLSSSDVSVLCGSDGYLVATLKDANGKPVEGASVGFANYGVKYFVTDANGQAKYPTSGLAEGTYNVKMCYYGNGIYAASNQVSAKITVGKIATKLSSSEVSVLYHDTDGYLVATLKDANGKPVEGASVGFANYGVKYFVTDANGQAKYPTSGLAEGTYNVKMCYYGNGTYLQSNQVSAKITVGKIATKLSSSDVSVLYHDTDGYLVATLKDANGKPVKGASVGFANNGVKYFVTDAKGQAKYPTKDLAKGTYNVKICYFGNDTYLQSNKVTANIVVGNCALTSNGITTTYGADDYLVATLTAKDNKPLSGEKITFTVFGKQIVDTTDSSGNAKISTKGYDPGIYNVILNFNGNSMYDAVSSTTKITIKKA